MEISEQGTHSAPQNVGENENFSMEVVELI